MNRWCLWSGVGVKNNSLSIFYVALSTCSVVLPICHVVLSTWSVILLICPVILSTCCVILSHYRTAPIDLRCLQKCKSLLTICALTKDADACWSFNSYWSVSVLFPWYEGNFFNLSKSVDRSFHATLCFIRKCNCSTW